MAEGLYLALAFVASTCGMGLLALAMKPHWEQARALAYPVAKARTLRGLGSAALALALVLCLLADHPSMAALVWVMALTLSALLVASTLAYRPRWLGWLVSWVR